ncbi:MAG: hypothetical protein JWQ71_754 [Pedosphaera sp.]|nr:hypothetical protein [Pedosphaera sp.]
MNDPVYQLLREQSWRRRLTKAEEARLRDYLATHPEAQQDWELETGLNQAFDRLPNVPVASNFTACVLQAVEQELAAQTRAKSTKGWHLRWTSWIPKAAVAMVTFSSCLFFYHQHQVNARHAMADSVVLLSETVSANPGLMEDFDAIRHLGGSKPRVDTEILALLQ